MSLLQVYKIDGDLFIGQKREEGMVYEECDFPWVVLYGSDLKVGPEFLGVVNSVGVLMKGKQGRMNEAMEKFLAMSLPILSQEFKHGQECK